MNDVTLTEMMVARDRRAEVQQQMIQESKLPLICFTLNIPGPVKVFQGSRKAFFIGLGRIQKQLNTHNLTICNQKLLLEKTGYEAFLAVNASAETLKQWMTAIEDQDDLGRLFDIDILSVSFKKLSRETYGLPARQCLLCDNPAHACSRNRKHSVEELMCHIHGITDCVIPSFEFVTYLGQAASYALIAEVSTTPKPGLVDLKDSGAHDDMDCKTFAASIKTIVPYIQEMAEAGFWWEGTLKALFPLIRVMGIHAEKAMFHATKGVNTHKGIIFSMGILSAVSAWYYRKHSVFNTHEILEHCSFMVTDYLEQDFLSIDKNHPKTHGEKLYVQYGEKGIRGEVQNGFPSVKNGSLPLLKKYIRTTYPKNLVFIQVLLALMSNVNDTNILIRSDLDTLNFMKQEAKRILNLGGAFEKEGLDAVRNFNETCIKRHISPGGCADLLAITIFLWQLEEFQEGF